MTNTATSRRLTGFTLMETVIAIGVLAVLVTAFLAVFGPATQGIRRAINVQDADRLVATLEKEMSILRSGTTSGYMSAFDKAFEWVREAGNPASEEMIMLYQYRGDPDSFRIDGTMEAYPKLDGVAGQDYVVQSMARLRSDPLFLDDLKGRQGRVFGVRTRQLVFDGSQLSPAGEDGEIRGMNDGSVYASALDYPDAVIVFSARFYALASNSEAFLREGGALKLENLGKPVFTRNLGVRR